MVIENQGFATQDMAVDKELVHANESDILVDDTYHPGDELGGFSSIDDLEDFLRTFEAGSEDEATLSTQGEGDVDGEPIDTVH